MKLPFNVILGPLIKPHSTGAREFCAHTTFSYSLLYSHFYAVVGLVISILNFRKHFAEIPEFGERSDKQSMRGKMLLHDFKVISSSMGIIQYACLVFALITDNPALFLPHLFGQLLLIFIKIVNSISLLGNFKAMVKLKHRIPSILLMTFNLSQEFCVFRRCLCLCDL